MSADSVSSGAPLGRLKTLEELQQLVHVITTSQRGYQELIDNLDELVFTLSLDGKVLAANRPVVVLLGQSFPALIGHRFDEFLDEPAMPSEDQLQWFLDDRYWVGIVRLRPKNSAAVRYFECALHAIVKDGRVSGISGMARDITRQHEIETRFKELFEAVQEGVYVSTADAKLLDANPALVRMLGYKAKEQLLGRSINDFCAEENQAVRPEAAGTAGAVYREVTLRRNDGTTLICLNASSATRDFFGRITRYQGTLVDITDRKRAEQALRASEENYRGLFENANDMVFTQDPAGNFTSFNQAGERISGYSRDEALKLNFAKMVAPEQIDVLERWNQDWISGKEPGALELQIVAKDGRRVTVEVSARPILKDGRPAGLQGIARDVTEHRNLEEQLRQAHKMEAIGRLAGGIAHDFNNLLTVIIGSCDLLLGDAEPAGPLGHHASDIKKAASRAAELTCQLLAFSRRQGLEPKVLDLNFVVKGVEGLLHRLIGEDIELITVPAPNPCKTKADPNQIEQVLLNLAVNARDAMPGGGRLTIETADAELDPEYARHLAVQPGRYVMMVVTDTGCGMDAHTRAHAFEPFFTTKEATKGTGLGLSMVYGIVQQSSGHITIESEVGRGTTFRIYLPATESAIYAEAPQRAAPVGAGCSETILLVEDDDGVRGMISEILRQKSYKVLEARDGREALSIAESYPDTIHLLMTDVVMPHLGGPELVEQLAHQRKGTKVLFMSGYDPKGQLGGMDKPFITKPFFVEDFLRKVAEVLVSA